ncbi:MAG: L-histidine N(alpha)-methyltransferase [Patescibacteria group bacterium]
MEYYTAREIADKYNVSAMTVSRWVANSQNKKNSLLLTTSNGKKFILKNSNNTAEIERLSRSGKINKPHSNIKRAKPSKTFYNAFTDEQVLTILNAIETSSEIPNKFTFVNNGAEIWDDYYVKNSINSNNYTTPNRVKRLLSSCTSYINFISEDFNTLNVIDIGQGNALHVIDYLLRLHKKNRVSKYLALDISEKMNNLALKNVRKALPNIDTTSYVCDTETSNFDKIFFVNTQEEQASKSQNLILYLGSMIGMHDDPIRVLRNFRLGMRKSDILMISNTIDSPINRVDFSYAKNPSGDRQNTWIPENIGIDVNQCELVTKYDQETNKRKLNLKLDKNYELSFELLGKHKTIELWKGQEINLWKHQMSTPSMFLKQIDEAGLRLTNMCIEKDNSHMLAMCMVKDGNL